MRKDKEKLMLFKEFLAKTRKEMIAERTTGDKILFFLGLQEQPFDVHFDMFVNAVKIFSEHSISEIKEEIRRMDKGE